MQTDSQPQNSKPLPRRKKGVKMTPVMWLLLAAFLLAALLTAALTFMVVREYVISTGGPLADLPFFKPAQTQAPALNSSAPLQPSSGPTPEPWNGSERVNILVMGLDYRDWEGGGPSRTDTMILFTIDPVTHSAGMLSIPRDLWVNIPGFDYGKINTAYYLGELYQLEGGGPGLAMKTVENLLGIQINYYAQVDFAAFEKLVDLIGGIDLDISEEISVDPIGPNNTVVLDPGTHHVDGAVALAYARNRDTIGSDFDRSQRQQQVILAIRKRVLDFNMMTEMVRRAPQIYQELAAGIHTNLSLDDAIRLGWLAAQIPSEGIKKSAIGPNEVTISVSPDGLDILLPDTDAIRALRDDLFTASGPIKPQAQATAVVDVEALAAQENARISVLNATKTVGLAANTTDFLQANGVTVAETGNAQEIAEKTAIIDYSGKPYTTQLLVKIMKLDPSQIYSRYDPNSQVDIAILLGNDWVDKLPSP